MVINGDMEVKETWKPIKGFEKLYEVSDFGNVRNRITKKCLSLVPKVHIVKGEIKHVSLIVQLYDRETKKLKPKFVNRLVAKAFIPNPGNKRWVKRIDENIFNNCVDNLEWTNYDFKHK